MPTHYAIRHITRFTLRRAGQRERDGAAHAAGHRRPAALPAVRGGVQPRARVFAYRDFLGNWVHHFDIPRRHAQLAITARAQVQIDAPRRRCPRRCRSTRGHAVDEWAGSGEHWDFRQPSHFAVWTAALLAFAASLGPLAERQADPLTTVRDVMAAMHARVRDTRRTRTRVDSPIDEALAARRGVCQDFTHIMLAVLRRLGAAVPLRERLHRAPRAEADDRGAKAPSPRHAWLEVLLPELGWVGFDPDQRHDAGVRHVRVAIGRDYADVPPTRGVFKGDAREHAGGVGGGDARREALPTLDPAVIETSWVADLPSPLADDEPQKRSQQQQQQ